MFKKRWIQREKIKAVHDYDLEQFLSSIGVLEDIKNGHYYCTFCNTLITMENLGAVYPNDNKIIFVCDRLSCLDKMNLTHEDKND